MATRIAGCLSLLSFATCLVAGVLVADNPIETTVMRALYALAGTFVIGWLAGAMAQRMLRENLERTAEQLKEKRREQIEAADKAPQDTAEIPTVGS